MTGRLFGILPLVKEIVSKAGEVHFRRWAVVETKLFNIYVHNILKSDEEQDPHDHPWAFLSFVLSGGYSERVWAPFGTHLFVRGPGAIVYHSTKDFHKLTLLRDQAWTLVFTGSRTHDPWGYRTMSSWIDYKTYRRMKHLDVV